MKMVKVVSLNLIYSLSESRGGSLFVEGNGLPVLMLDFACGKGRVLLVNDVPVVVCVFGLQCDAVAAGAYDMKVSTVNILSSSVVNMLHVPLNPLYTNNSIY